MRDLMTERQETDGVEVEALCRYDAAQSQPEKSYFFFAYTIKISNKGSAPVTLVSRRWTITDGFGRVRTVEGDGVVGKQPTLGPGESFEYTSFCPLPTPTGSMVGLYVMKREDGATFEARIPQFFLVEPSSYH